MEEVNKENGPGRSLLGAFNMLKRRPLQAIASQGEDESVPLLRRPLTFTFSKPLEVLPKSEATSLSETVTEEKPQSKHEEAKHEQLGDTSVIPPDAHAPPPIRAVDVPPSSRVKTHDLKIEGYSHAMKISKYDFTSKNKEEDITAPEWIVYFHPYFEDSIKANVQLESATPPSDPKGSRGMRMILVDWLAMLQVYLRQDDSVLQLAVRLMDKVLTKKVVPSEIFQLTALAAFWIASKTEMQYSVAAWALCKLCKNSYTVTNLYHKEKDVMKTLEYQVPLDTPISMSVYIIMKLGLSENKELHHLTTYLLDVSLLSWEISWLPHSQLASAATCCALQLLSLFNETEWEKLSLFDSACHSRDSLRETIAAQLHLLKSVHGKDSKFTGIRDKYTRSRYLKVGKLIHMKDIEDVQV